MKTRISTALFLLVPALSMAQVPVDDDGNVIGQYESQSNITPIVDDGVPRLSYAELQDLVGPIALYPDDLLAIVLPASAYPLQIVEASRFLKALETDSSLQPDPDWDDSIVAILNYPEVVDLLNEDLDWTLRLGEAVVAQQTDVVSAIEAFRDRAYAAGNLKSDEYQTVANDEGVISISPVSEDVIYVPYYEPAQVVYYQATPAYYYYPRAYPVYYYPYAANHHFNHGYFWGVTTAFSIGWMSDSLHVHHHSYRSHPYYGRTYWNDGWYRHPSVSVYNTTYVNNNVYVNRNGHGDQWHASNTRREYVRREGYSRNERRSDNRSAVRSNEQTSRQVVRDDNGSGAISFRERETRASRTGGASPKNTRRLDSIERTRIQFARRDENNARTEPVRRQEATTRTQVDTSRRQTTRRQEPTTRSDVDTARRQTTRRQEPTTRSDVDTARRQTTRRQEPATQTRVQTTRRQEPAVRSQPATRSQPAPRPTQQRAPVQQQTRQTVSPPPRQEAQRSSPPRETRSSGSNSQRSESRSTESRSTERRRSER